MNEETTVIEINGIKMEVDLRHAKRVENFRVGSKVKILNKEYSSHKVFHGIVVGFDNFKNLPTIIVAYLDISYSSTELKFAYINAENDKTELVLSIDDEFPINRSDVLEQFRKERAQLQEKLDDVNRKEAYFLRHFNQYFNDAIPEEITGVDD